jgi:hypothetical protein
MIRVRNAAIYGTNSRALWFFMKAGAFCAFIGNNEIYFTADGRKFIMYAYHTPVCHAEGSLNAGAF